MLILDQVKENCMCYMEDKRSKDKENVNKLIQLTQNFDL